MGGRLLVVDFDFFFHNPGEGLPAEDRGPAWLYDWQHAENHFMRETIWPLRAEEFLRAGIQPPRCAGMDGFWNRFTFTSPDPPLFYADSNLYAGHLTPLHYALFDMDATVWQEVHLFDAHHDSACSGHGGGRRRSRSGRRQESTRARTGCCSTTTGAATFP
ncbi:hypothetical protein AB0I84_23285 [Streptomyces spectabilis]|uniref:hypothetical protein n=1 Tax=Streptomyces spectabilis TaxID=68270 RepID=UPI003402E885